MTGEPTFEVIRQELEYLRLKTLPRITAAALRERAPAIASISTRGNLDSPLVITEVIDTLRQTVARCQPLDRQRAASDLLGLDPSRHFGSLAARRNQAGEHFNVSGNTFRQNPAYEKSVLEEVASQLTRAAHAGSVHPATELRSQVASNTQVWIDRPKERATVETWLSAQAQPMMLVHGEPGVGKSDLVLRAVIAESSRQTVKVRMTTHDTMDHDLTAACILGGLEADEIGAIGPRSAFLLVARRNAHRWVVHFENVRSLDPYIRAFRNLPEVKVVVESRLSLPFDNGPVVQVGELSDAEGLELLQRLGMGDNDDKLTQLASSLGNRPLALKQIATFMGRTHSLSVDDLIQAMQQSMGKTIDSAARLAQTDQNLRTAYMAVRVELDREADAALMLDLLVWVSSDGVVLTRFLLELASASIGGPEAGIRAEGALMHLENVGLVSRGPRSDQGENCWLSHFAWEMLFDITTPNLPRIGRVVEHLVVERALELGLRGGKIPLLRLMGRVGPVGHIAVEYAIAARIQKHVWYASWGVMIILGKTGWLRFIPDEELGTRFAHVRFTPDGVYQRTADSVQLVEGQELRLVLNWIREYHRLVYIWSGLEPPDDMPGFEFPDLIHEERLFSGLPGPGPT